LADALSLKITVAWFEVWCLCDVRHSGQPDPRVSPDHGL